MSLQDTDLTRKQKRWEALKQDKNWTRKEPSGDQPPVPCADEWRLIEKHVWDLCAMLNRMPMCDECRKHRNNILRNVEELYWDIEDVHPVMQRYPSM
jgi:hypothetical protein